jgi:hypothetical protein
MTFRLAMVLTLAAVGLAAVGGAAIAQDQSGAMVPMPLATPIRGQDATYQPGKASELLIARYNLRRACAADLLARCPDKDGAAADRCLEYHRLSFTLPCRKAIAAFEHVAPPRSALEGLAVLAPVSGPIPPPEQRPAPAPSRGSPRSAVGD